MEGNEGSRATVREAADDTRMRAEGMAEEAKDKAQDIKAKAEDVLDTAKDKAAEVGAQASDKIDSAMTTAGEQMGSLAQTVREKAPSDGPISDVAQSAATALERGGSYLEQADVSAVRGDLEMMIRKHPIEALLIGVGLGMLLARSTRR